MALISCKDLTMRYENQVAVDHVTFQIQEGDYLCIVGENGSGKSTLLKGLLGLLHPASGSITYGDGLKRNMIGYLPQQTVVQKDFPASVWEVVLSGCLNRRGLRPFYSPAERQRARENIVRMDIGAIVKSCYRDLSGGQQQRVLRARALCATENLLRRDQPVTGLDPGATAECADPPTEPPGGDHRHGQPRYQLFGTQCREDFTYGYRRAVFRQLGGLLPQPPGAAVFGRGTPWLRRWWGYFPMAF